LTQTITSENSAASHPGNLSKQYSEQDGPVVEVGDLMTQTLISVNSKDSVMEAAKTMTERKVSSVLVSLEGEIYGIVTDHDIISRVVARGLDPNTVKVETIMSSPLMTIVDKVGIDEAAQRMADEKVRRLIVERESKIVGIIGESDIIRIEPELHFLIREQRRVRPMLKSAEGQSITLAGYCEECGNYSPQLKKVEGRWLDEDCNATE
jgi:signal-transduction protein with cAMP-binding, CBS, and nucleotidyltransferase domain